MDSEVILYVVLVLGIVVAGGFLIFFVGDLLMSIFGSKKDEKAIKAKKDREEGALKEKIENLPEEEKEAVKNTPEVASIVYGGAVVEAYNPDEEETAEPEAESVEEEPTEEDVEEENQDDIIAQRRRELMERLARMSEEDEDDDEDEDEDEEEDETEEVDAQDLDEDEEEDSDEDVEEDHEQSTTVAAITLGEEELLARLNVEEERLKLNEKELRACKKEYMPLKRVSRTLESDERKLRRKEALVAKQKVVLYGVNNYSDIDEEKAKKLAEDLDLLDGLKLSVEHCKEVMEKNADRFPLLEKMYEILSKQNADLKESVERTRAELETLRAKKGN